MIIYSIYSCNYILISCTQWSCV